MLVLSRKAKQRLLIGDEPDQIVITVVRIGPNNVRLGIDAPKWMGIHREDVTLQLKGVQEGDDVDLDLGELVDPIVNHIPRIL